MKPIKIIQVGMGHDHAGATMKCMRGLDAFEVLGVCEPNPAYLDRLKKPEYQGLKQYSLEEVLSMPDLEAVAVECEEERATEYAQLFAERGIHVHLDKPGSHGYASFANMVETMRRNKLVLQMGYMYRYNPAVLRTKEMIARGELGDVYAVEAQMSVRHPKEKHEWLKKHQGGMMYFLGCHDIDLVLQFMGGEPDEVIPLNTATYQNGVDCEDYGFAVLKYPRGASFVKTCAAEYNGYHRRQLVVCGTKGTVELKPFEVDAGGSDRRTDLRYTTEEAERGKRWWDTSTLLELEPYDRYDGMMQAFADMIRGKYENPYTYDYELTLFRTVMRCCGVTEE